MRRSIAHILTAAAIGAFMALSAAPAGAKTVKECNAEYADNKAAIQGAKIKKADFLAQCKAGTEVIPTTTAAPAPAPAAPSPAPTAAPKPAVVAASPSGSNGLGTEALAKAKCPADTVVWVNLKSKIYHFAGTHNYGTTKSGAYMCEADAKAAGDRAAQNEKHP
jgi:hypothetical protein